MLLAVEVVQRCSCLACVSLLWVWDASLNRFERFSGQPTIT